MTTLIGASPGGGDAAGAPARGAVRPGHLDLLEAHAVFVLREVVAECERPVLLFDGGTGSAVLLRLAEKAFRPGRFPFPVLHVDTGHSFGEVLSYRHRRRAGLGEELVVASVQESIDPGRVADPGPGASRRHLHRTTLLDAVAAHGSDACIGGARRDEDGARAKGRILSFRDALGQWDPRRRRPGSPRSRPTTGRSRRHPPRCRSRSASTTSSTSRAATSSPPPTAPPRSPASCWPPCAGSPTPRCVPGTATASSTPAG